MQTSEQAAAPAADSQSIESRIGAWLSGPEPELKNLQPAPKQNALQGQAPPNQQPDQIPEQTEATSETTEVESTAPAFEEVEYEGETYQVPPKLKEAIIRQGDYTKKTQELSQQRQLVEHQQQQMRLAGLQQQFEQSIATERQQIGMLDYLIGESAKADWSSMSTDDLLRARMKLDQMKESKAGLEAQIGKKQQEHLATFRQQLEAAQGKAKELLKQRIPQWSEATEKEVRDWALSNGFTKEEVSSIYDPRHAEVLWKASQYDKARKSAQPAVTAAKAAKVSGANPMPAEVREKLNFRKAVAKTEGNAQERRAVVEQRITSIFGKK